MPCKSDYLGPNQREKELQRAAKLLVWVMNKFDRAISSDIAYAAGNVYCSDDRPLLLLCEFLTNMPSDVREDLIYGNAKDRMARDLADWWEDHQKADAERKVEETSTTHVLTVHLHSEKPITERLAIMVVNEMMAMALKQCKTVTSLDKLSIGDALLDAQQRKSGDIVSGVTFSVGKD